MLHRTYQAWLDTPTSLRLKYALVKKMGIRGTGPYMLQDLGYDTAQARADSAAMWAAMKM